MDQENNIDELDKMLFDYFDSNKDIPDYINETIHNTLQREKKQRNSFNIMKKVAMIIISFGIISTGIVFADDIINFITSIFTNSTDGIDSAIQNGYIQNVNMDFVYDNDIGVKVDALVLDDTNLDISFIYNYQGNEKIDSLEIHEYTIKDENNNILYEFNEKQTINNSKFIITEMIRDNKTIQIQENIYKESLIYSNEKISNSNKIIIEIQSIKVICGNNINKIIGDWEITIDINDLLTERINEYYNIVNNTYIDNGTITLTETSLKIKLKFKCKLNEQILNDRENIILMDSIGKKYYYKFLDMKYIDNVNELYLEYDIGKNFNNIEKLKLIIKDNDEIELNLFK